MRWTKRRLTIALMLAAALTASTAAIAAQRHQPDTDEVMAEVAYTHVKVKHRECEGVDGPYAEEFVRVSGTSTGDPRLSGDVEVRIYLIVNIENGVGIEEGTFTIRDPATGSLKARGRLKDAGTAEITQGVIFGRVHSEGAGPGEETQGDGQIIANFRTTFGPEGVTTQIGGEALDGRLPAVVWSGHCTGPYEHFEADISEGEATAPAATAASRGLSGWSRLAQ
jgi:hypothetical protein